MEIKFTNEYPDSKIDEIISYLSGDRLWIPQTDYPDFFDWLDKSYLELKRQTKRAMLAIDKQEIVGILVYQAHKTKSDTLELKNLTIRPEIRGRQIASFLLRNSEIEGVREFRAKEILCDTKVNNFAIRYFLEKNHYKVLRTTDLYRLNSNDDVVFCKKVNAFGFVY